MIFNLSSVFTLYGFFLHATFRVKEKFMQNCLQLYYLSVCHWLTEFTYCLGRCKSKSIAIIAMTIPCNLRYNGPLWSMISYHFRKLKKNQTQSLSSSNTKIVFLWLPVSAITMEIFLLALYTELYIYVYLYVFIDDENL